MPAAGRRAPKPSNFFVLQARLCIAVDPLLEVGDGTVVDPRANGKRKSSQIIRLDEAAAAAPGPVPLATHKPAASYYLLNYQIPLPRHRNALMLSRKVGSYPVVPNQQETPP